LTIINPAMIVTWLAGLYLAWAGHWYSSPWFHAKFFLVLVMSGVHGFFLYPRGAMNASEHSSCLCPGWQSVREAPVGVCPHSKRIERGLRLLR
jgi:uncharacterized membrane protein